MSVLDEHVLERKEPRQAPISIELLQPAEGVVQDTQPDLDVPDIIDEVISVSAMQRIVRSEVRKKARLGKAITSRERDESIRTLIDTHRRLNKLDPEETSPEEQKRIQRIQEHCASLVFEHVQPAFVAVTSKYHGDRRERAESAAREGLWKAFLNFDPEQGTMFSTYASRMMSGTIQHLLRDETIQARTYSRTDIDKFKPVQTLIEDGVDIAKACKSCGITEEEYTKLFHKIENGTIGSTTTDEGMTDVNNSTDSQLVEQTAIARQTFHEIAAQLDVMKLTNTKEKVLELAFGFRRDEDGKFYPIPGFLPQLTDTEISKLAGVSQSATSKIKRDFYNYFQALNQ